MVWCKYSLFEALDPLGVSKVVHFEHRTTQSPGRIQEMDPP